MHSGRVEVRLFKPAAAPPANAEEEIDSSAKPGFGLFVLERKSETRCDF
jgi:hypothetical protein